MSQETIRAAERAAGQVKTMSTYDPDSDQLHEECGIFGVWAPDRDVARLTYFGLRALQHRGQESAGIAVGDGGTVMVRKDLGLLDRVFSNADLSTLSGQLAVGHVRYGTAGAKSWEASQPHLSTINSVIIALAHNGTLVNTDELRRQLIELGVPFLSNSDSEVATKLIGYFTQRTGHLREGIRKTMELVRGGYAMTLINEQALYAFRDPHGIRPLVLGKLVDEGLDQADAASVRSCVRKTAPRRSTPPSMSRAPAAGSLLPRPAHSTSWAPSTSVTSVPARSCASAPRVWYPSRACLPPKSPQTASLSRSTLPAPTPL